MEVVVRALLLEFVLVLVVIFVLLVIDFVMILFLRHKIVILVEIHHLPPLPPLYPQTPLY